MTTEQKKIAAISKIAELEDEQLLDAVNKLLEAALPPKALKSRKPGWAKDIITYVSEDFDEYTPPGFYGEEEDEVSN